jgi:hypothetical protein
MTSPVTIALPNILNINELKAQVSAMRKEFDQAVAFHATWSPMVHDSNLIERMGASYATNTFNVIQIALRREMLFALMRIWDTNRQSINLQKVAATLNEQTTTQELANERNSSVIDLSSSNGAYKEMIMACLVDAAQEAIALIGSWSKDGEHFPIRDNLTRLRNEFLAHHQIESAVVTLEIRDHEIDSFFDATLRLVRLLMSLVNRVSYNPSDTGDVYDRHAKLFWASVRGEKTLGHPNFSNPQF